MQRSQPSDDALFASRRVAFTSGGHVAHDGPVHDAEHAHEQPVLELPLTLVACALQFADAVQRSGQSAA